MTVPAPNSREVGFMQGGVAETSQRQRALGMPAHPRARKRGRPILTTHTAVSGLTPTMSSSAETGRGKKLPVLEGEGASLDSMCEALPAASASVPLSWQLLASWEGKFHHGKLMVFVRLVRKGMCTCTRRSLEPYCVETSHSTANAQLE